MHVVSWLLFSVDCIGQVRPNLPYGLHTKIVTGIRDKTPIPYALESWGPLKCRLGLASALSAGVMFTSATLVDLFLPDPIILIYSATAASAWPSCQILPGSLVGPTPELFWARGGSGAVHQPPLASAALHGAGENNSSGFWNDLPVMLSHFRARNRFQMFFSVAWFPPSKIAISALCYIRRHLECKLEGNSC